MKANFLVSPHPHARLPGAERLFVTDPYVEHILKKTGEIDNYREVRVAARSRTTRDAFERDHDFVRCKFNQYIPLLAHRLNEIHETHYEEEFWRKALALGPLRHISLCFDLYQVCEQNLDTEEHDCRILSESSFFIPRDFNEHRRLFQHSDFGQEQLFAVYCRLFQPDRFSTWEAKHQWPTGPARLSEKQPGMWQRLAALPKRVVRRLLRLRRPAVGILNSYFSAPNVDRLLFRSLGKVQVIRLPELAQPALGSDWDKRGRLSRFEDTFDDFDRFVFATLFHAMPRAFVEDAGRIVGGYREFFTASYPGLKWVVSEAWIGDMHTAMALAVLGQSGIRHLYNEHNYFAHPFVGNNLQFVIPLVDEFATLGWHAQGDPRIVASGSLFGWRAPERTEPHGGIVLVSSLPQVRAPEISACYGEAGPVNVPRYFDFLETFLCGLADDTLAELIVRAYPTGYPRTLQAWDFKYRLEESLAKVKEVNDSEGGAKALIGGARLVVLDYFSTSSIEALSMNVPTVVLWNPRTRYLLDEYSDFFAPLRRAGICQADPGGAARFIEQIKTYPGGWWHDPGTKAAREEFLAKNFGKPSVLIRRILKLARATV
jgi:putative transferase (TIGR04331 family)